MTYFEKLPSKFLNASVPYWNFVPDEPQLIFSEERLTEKIQMLSPSERDTLHLYYWNPRSQKDVAIIMGCSQNEVSYRLSAIKQKMEYFLHLDLYKSRQEKLKEWLRVGKKPDGYQLKMDDLLETLNLYYECFSQSEIGKKKGLTQIEVRGRLITIRRCLTCYLPESKPELDHFEYVFSIARTVAISRGSHMYREARNFKAVV